MLTEVYRRAQFLSLDIVIGAVILLRFFSNLLSVEPSWSVYVLLAGAVWLIYTIDHLRDASKVKGSERNRYRFHLKYGKVLVIACVLVAILSMISLYYTSPIIIIAGALLALLSAVYLLIQHLLSNWGMKELYVAIIFTSGILLAPFVMSETIRFDVFLLLLLLSFSNLVLFSWFEKEEDNQDGFKSVATTMSESSIQKLILLLLSVGIAFSITIEFSEVSLYFLVSFGLYSYLFIDHKRAKRLSIYRTIGDGIFLIPIIFEWL